MSGVEMHLNSRRCVQCGRQAICLCRTCQKLLCGVCAGSNGLCWMCGDGDSGSFILSDGPLPPLRPVAACRELVVEGG